jgi:hypothetical protein
MMADMRKRRGRMLVFHRALVLVGEMSMSVPREDWCMKERTTPAQMKMGRTIRTRE